MTPEARWALSWAGFCAAAGLAVWLLPTPALAWLVVGVAVAVVVALVVVTSYARGYHAEHPEQCPNCITPWKCNGPHVGEGIEP